ncbi:MAG: 4Fe-4S binding protein [Gammaproteobacteria bacterium]|nr:4Fe-4S binding protein [Gammaproteobacteria bacterium]
MGVAEEAGNRVPTRWRRDITAVPGLGGLLRNPWPLTIVRLAVLALLVLGIIHGLTHPDDRKGLTLLLFWGLFWPLLTVLVTPTLGNLFCAICPHGFIGRWLSRVGLQRRFPKTLRGGGIGLLILIFGYWFIHYTMPGLLSRSTVATAWYFLGFTVFALTSFYVFSGMAYCKHLCPLGRLLAVHGKLGATQITTRTEDCATCRGFECAKACRYKLSPFRFEANNNMQQCTLCMDCVQACDSVRVQIQPPGVALFKPVKRAASSDYWVLLMVLAVAGVAVQMLHGMQHSGLRDSLPWNVVGGWLNAALGISPGNFDMGRLLGFGLAVAATLLAAWVGYRRAASVAGVDYLVSRQTLAYGMAPAAILGLMPHAITRFLTTDAHVLLNELSALMGGSMSLEPLATRSDPWLGYLGLIAYFGMAWSLATIWKRSCLLVPGSITRLRVWVWASMPVLLYVGIYAFKVWALATYGPAHQH